jgi:hypothetical protein
VSRGVPNITPRRRFRRRAVVAPSTKPRECPPIGRPHANASMLQRSAGAAVGRSKKKGRQQVLRQEQDLKLNLQDAGLSRAPWSWTLLCAHIGNGCLYQAGVVRRTMKPTCEGSACLTTTLNLDRNAQPVGWIHTETRGSCWSQQKDKKITGSLASDGRRDVP